MPAFEWSSAKVLFFHFLYSLHLSPPPYPDMSSKRSLAWSTWSCVRGVEKSCCVRPLHSTFLAGKQSKSQNKACVLPFLLKSLSTRLVWGGGDQSIYGSIASTDRAHYYYIQSTFFSRQSPLSLISTSDKIVGNQLGSRTENKLWLHWGVFVVNTHPRGGGAPYWKPSLSAPTTMKIEL